jgi:hypothetical protein
MRGVVGPLPYPVSRKTIRNTRNVAVDIERVEASLTSGVMVAGALCGSCETGCWKILFDCGVWLTGNDGLMKLMFVIVRHGQEFNCKAHV